MEKTFETVETHYEDKDFVKGDVVKSYKDETALVYPCFILKCDVLENFRVQAMKGMLSKPSLLPTEEVYTVYVEMQGMMVRVGTVPTRMLKVLVADRAYASFDKRVLLDSQTVIMGDMLYALCPSTHE